ncbi:hypothetical protein SLEP1_g57183 [Rubroshorea leprosula]|uniref:Uncharacterized protein n=1 Tax=Rubroshorea leprosula TaxID=152421 RepID=A0AAV5MKG9_9ROSI|nr:hypothetical protein SLEP1_g57183 [Rubroshorea leprosula]
MHSCIPCTHYPPVCFLLRCADLHSSPRLFPEPIASRSRTHYPPAPLLQPDPLCRCNPILQPDLVPALIVRSACLVFCKCGLSIVGGGSKRKGTAERPEFTEGDRAFSGFLLS